MILNFETSIQPGEFLALHGPSGAGKTSTLRMLAGLMDPDNGVIIHNDEKWYDHESGINRSPQKRKIGFLFQDYALFPNMTVEENILFALKKGQPKKIADDLIEMIELENLKDRRPESLSGGQQQRVALARALVQRPVLLLLDEPLSALDPHMRTKLQDHLLTVHNEYGFTTIMVSHDLSEIFKLADKVIELRDGKIIKSGSIKEVFSQPNLKSDLNFRAQIVEILINKDHSRLTCIVGDELTEVSIHSNSLGDLKRGDHVVISTDAKNCRIQKIS